MKKLIVNVILKLAELFLFLGCYNMYNKLAILSSDLDSKWKTGQWKEVKKEKTFKSKILNFDVIDSEGDFFTKENIIIKSSQSKPLTMDFNGDIISQVTLTIEEDGVYAEIPCQFKDWKLYPAIGGARLEDGRISIKEVSLCKSPNVDPTIKPI